MKLNVGNCLKKTQYWTKNHTLYTLPSCLNFQKCEFSIASHETHFNDVFKIRGANSEFVRPTTLVLSPSIVTQLLSIIGFLNNYNVMIISNNDFGAILSIVLHILE